MIDDISEPKSEGESENLESVVNNPRSMYVFMQNGKNPFSAGYKRQTSKDVHYVLYKSEGKEGVPAVFSVETIEELKAGMKSFLRFGHYVLKNDVPSYFYYAFSKYHIRARGWCKVSDDTMRKLLVYHDEVIKGSSQ